MCVPWLESECRDSPIECRYYNGVSVGSTTTSSGSSVFRDSSRLIWVALALTCMPWIVASSSAADDADSESISIFPLQAAWTVDLGQGPATRPGYDDVHAYVPLRDGTLTAIQLTDGVVAWSIEQPTLFSPVAGDGVVVVADATLLIALRAGDAQALWTLDLGSPISASPLWSAGWLIAALDSGEVVAVRGFDGQELWRQPLDGPLHVQPTIGGNELFVPVEDGRVVALDLRTGTRLWERVLGGSPQKVLPLDAVFVGATDNYLYRLSRDSGRIDWRWRTGGDVVGAAAVDERSVFFVSLDNFLWALDRGSGVQQWRRSLAGRPRAGPALVGNVLLVSGVAAQLRTFRTDTGREANVLLALGELGAPPHLGASLSTSGLRMVLAIADGRIVGMRPAFGPPQFSLDFPPQPLLAGPERLAPADVLPFEPLPVTDPDQLAGPASGTQSGKLSLPAEAGSSVAPPWPPQIASPQPASGSDTTEVPQPDALVFTVQVGAFRNMAASALASRLLDAGYAAYVVESPGTANGRHRVRVGRALSRPAAERLAGQLAQELQLDPVLVQVP